MSTNLLYAFIAVLASGLLGFALGRNTDLLIQIQAGDDFSTSMTVKGKAINYVTLLNDIYNKDKNKFMRSAVNQWLLENHDIVEVTDLRLASTIENKACSEIPKEPLSQKIAELQKCAEKPANAQLRELALKRRGIPFHPVGRETKMSVPDPPTVPEKGKAAVCDKNLLGKKIEVYNERLNTSVYVKATGDISCSSFSKSTTQLHLNPANAKELLGVNNPVGIHTVYVIEVID